MYTTPIDRKEPRVPVAQVQLVQEPAEHDLQDTAGGKLRYWIEVRSAERTCSVIPHSGIGWDRSSTSGVRAADSQGRSCGRSSITESLGYCLFDPVQDIPDD